MLPYTRNSTPSATTGRSSPCGASSHRPIDRDHAAYTSTSMVTVGIGAGRLPSGTDEQAPSASVSASSHGARILTPLLRRLPRISSAGDRDPRPDRLLWCLWSFGV